MDSASVDPSLSVGNVAAGVPDRPHGDVTRTPTIAGQQMSAGLRERLKRSGRCYSSPVGTKKRRLDVKPSPESPKTYNSPKSQNNTDSSRTTSRSSPENCVVTGVDSIESEKESHSKASPQESSLPSSNSQTVTPSASDPVPAGCTMGGETRSENSRLVRLQLRDAVAKKEEKLRKLKMVKMYRAKNNLSELSRLIDKWRSVSQGALQDLLALSQSEPKPSLAELTRHLGVDHRLLNLNTDDDTFS